MKQISKIALAIIFIAIAGFQVPQQAPKIKFEVTLDEANIIMQALEKEPFGKVEGLVRSLYAQAQKQLSDTTAKPKK